jgi:hypothetical protein
MRFISLAILVLAVAAAFGIGRITVSPAPAVASIPMAAATTFSHFECYSAKFGGQFAETVQLTDQFQTYQTSVGPPELFCTPVVKKVISGPRLAVPTPPDHLTCYQIQGPTIQQVRPYANQFVSNQVQVGTPSLLCVPTHKSG